MGSLGSISVMGSPSSVVSQTGRGREGRDWAVSQCSSGVCRRVSGIRISPWWPWRVMRVSVRSEGTRCQSTPRNSPRMTERM
jgi:hypothetical protein